MKRLISAAVAAAALTVAACATPTPYQPYHPGGTAAGGYSEYQIGSDRFRVSFQGNTVTDRDTVERYLLYRAAELTLGEGHQWFALVDRDTERQSRTVTRPAVGYSAWQPTWYYLGRGRWVMVPSYDPFWNDRYDTDVITRYQATAEIFLGEGPKPRNDPNVFDAREVVQNLGPTIERPSA